MSHSREIISLLHVVLPFTLIMTCACSVVKETAFSTEEDQETDEHGIETTPADDSSAKIGGMISGYLEWNESVLDASQRSLRMFSKAVSGTRIYIEDSDLYSDSDETGYFIVTGVPPGTHCIYAVISDGEEHFGVRRCNIDISAGNETTVGYLPIEPTGSIAGTVILDGKEDHAGVEVTIDGINYRATTDSYGQFSVSDIPAGNYGMTANFPGYREKSVGNLLVHAGLHTTMTELWELFESYSCEDGAYLAVVNSYQSAQEVLPDDTLTLSFSACSSLDAEMHYDWYWGSCPAGGHDESSVKEGTSFSFMPEQYAGAVIGENSICAKAYLDDDNVVTVNFTFRINESACLDHVGRTAPLGFSEDYIRAAYDHEYLYVMEHHDETAIHIVNVSDPATPFSMGHEVVGITGESWQNALLINDYIMYVAGCDGSDSVLYVYDLSYDHANPQFLTRSTIDDDCVDYKDFGLAFDSGHLFVAHGDITILSILDPANPVTVGMIGGLEPATDNSTIFIRDGSLYISAFSGNQTYHPITHFDYDLRIWDVTSPASPVERNKFVFSDVLAPSQFFGLNTDYFFMTNTSVWGTSLSDYGYTSYLHIMSGFGSSASIVNSIPIISALGPIGVADDYVLIPDVTGEDGFENSTIELVLAVVNVSDPMEPVVECVLDPYGGEYEYGFPSVYHFLYDGNYLYVINVVDGVIDIYNSP